MTDCHQCKSIEGEMKWRELSAMSWRRWKGGNALLAGKCWRWSGVA